MPTSDAEAMDELQSELSSESMPAAESLSSASPVDTLNQAEAPSPATRDEPPPSLDPVIAKSVRYIKAKRGGDLAAIILAGSAARDALTPHSDVDFLVLVRGADSGHELVRVLDRIVEIRYMGLASAEEQVRTSPRLPIILRRARVLFEFESAGSSILDQALTRFRQGPTPPTIHERIRMRTEALHWLGKARDHQAQAPLARYVFSVFLDECVGAFYRLRGFWPASPTDSLRFISQRDPTLGELLQQALTPTDMPGQLDIGQQLADYLFKDIPAPARID
jgi:predicted nucleotidyltransferase